MPLVRIRDVARGYTETYTTEDVPSSYFVQYGDFLVGMDGNFNSRNWIGDTAILCQRTCKISSKDENFYVKNRFLSHILGPVFKKIEKNKPSGTVKHLLAKDINDIYIPIPPLPVQEEIIRILDNFTELIAELTTELTTELASRKKQYEYYSSRLFTDTNSNLVPLSKIAKFVYGYTDKANDFGDTRFIRITDINEQGYLNTQNSKYIMLNDDAKKSLLNKGDLIMARTGATYGKTLYFDSDEQCVYASFLIKIIPDKQKLNNKFYWHFTKTSLYWEQANKLVSNGGQPQFNTPALKQIKSHYHHLKNNNVS